MYLAHNWPEFNPHYRPHMVPWASSRVIPCAGVSPEDSGCTPPQKNRHEVFEELQNQFTHLKCTHKQALIKDLDIISLQRIYRRNKMSTNTLEANKPLNTKCVCPWIFLCYSSDSANIYQYSSFLLPRWTVEDTGLLTERFRQMEEERGEKVPMGKVTISLSLMPLVLFRCCLSRFSTTP